MSADLREQLRASLAERDAEFIDLCAELVRRPSENPPGDTTELFGFVAEYLDAKGITYDTVAPQPTMPNLVASFEGLAGDGPHLVLNGHLDVFPAGDRTRWTVDPFGGVVKDGKLYGRGATDMKAGVTASLITYTTLHDLRGHLRGRLTLTLVSDEETFGPWGARYLVEHAPVLGDALLNGEPSTIETVRFGEKGPLWIEVVFETIGGHGGYPHVSANAIKEAGRFIAELETLHEMQVPMPPEVRTTLEQGRAVLDRQLGDYATDTLMAVTVNIGLIEGGDKVNMIANRCRVEIDLRCPVGVTLEELLARFEEIVARYPNARFRVINSSPPNVCDPEARIFTLVKDNAEALSGVRPIPTISLGGTDARLWRLRGIPAAVYGPNPNNMGAPDEYVAIDELLHTVKTHVLTAWDYLTETRT
jgi:succinyl-diaminopimelate desuccinylase